MHEQLQLLRGLASAGMVRRSFALFDDALADVDVANTDVNGRTGADAVLEGFEALLDACRAAGHPNRALKLLRVMQARDVKPSLRAYSLLLTTLESAARSEDAVMALQACVAADMNPPADMFGAAMTATARAQDHTSMLRVLRLAQAGGKFTTIDEYLSYGVINVSGLSPHAAMAVLHTLLSTLRALVAAGRVAQPPHTITVFASSRTRSHVKSVLEDMGLPSKRRNWCMCVDADTTAEFFAA